VFPDPPTALWTQPGTVASMPELPEVETVRHQRGDGTDIELAGQVGVPVNVDFGEDDVRVGFGGAFEYRSPL